MSELTTEQKLTNYETLKHIMNVRDGLNRFIEFLIDRGENHDNSKLEQPELDYFTEHTKTLSGLTFGSPEYYEALKKLEPALKHHYESNSHHPQFYENGISGFDLVDLVEYFIDCLASSLRHKDGDPYKSLEINKERFSIDDQLHSILKNTLDRYF